MKAALTGHRPERLNLPYNVLDKQWENLYSFIKKTIINNNITKVFCGMANGCDILIGIVAIDLKNEGYDIKLTCVLPCKGYGKKSEFFNILRENANEWIELNEKFYKGCDDIRDQYMVDNCDVLIAIFDGIETGGVYSTIKKAQKQNKKIIYCSKELIKY